MHSVVTIGRCTDRGRTKEGHFVQRNCKIEIRQVLGLVPLLLVWPHPKYCTCCGIRSAISSVTDCDWMGPRWRSFIWNSTPQQFHQKLHEALALHNPPIGLVSDSFECSVVSQSPCLWDFFLYQVTCLNIKGNSIERQKALKDSHLTKLINERISGDVPHN